MSEARNVALMPVSGLDPDNLASRLEENFRRISATFQLPLAGDDITSVPAEKVTAGTFPAGSFSMPTFEVTTSFKASNSVGTGLYVRTGSAVVEIGRYLDFHTSGDADEVGTDFNARFNCWSVTDMDLSGCNFHVPSGHITAQGVGKLGIGHYGSAYMTIAHSNKFSVVGGYAMLAGDGVTLVNGASSLGLRINNSTRMSFDSECHTSVRLNVTGGILLNSDWYRLNGNNGMHWESHGGGWRMVDSTYVRVYGGKVLLGENQIRADRGADGGSWPDRGFRMSQPTRPGIVFYSISGPTANQFMVQTGAHLDAVDWNAGAGIPLRASAFQNYSARRGKQNIRYLEKQNERIRIQQLRPARFGRPHVSVCIACEGRGRVTIADYLLRTATVERTESTPVEADEEFDCPSCSTDGIPGQVNSPTIDLDEDSDFLGFIAEEVAEVYPEVIGWEPSDPGNWQSEPQPATVDIGALMAVLTVAVQDLSERVEQLERV